MFKKTTLFTFCESENEILVVYKKCELLSDLFSVTCLAQKHVFLGYQLLRSISCFGGQ